MPRRALPHQLIQPQQIPFTPQIQQPPRCIHQFHPPLLDHPNKRALPVILAKDILLRLMKLHLPAAGHLQQIRL